MMRMILTNLVLLAHQVLALHLVERSDPKVLALPIIRSEKPMVEIMQELQERDSYLQVPLNNFRYYTHHVNISLGTPPQSLQALIDTGSAFTLIHTPSSDLCTARREFCAELGTYAANQSSTYKYLSSDLGAAYLSGEHSSGDFATDDMNIGNVKVKAAQIGLMYKTNCTQNILGLAYTTAKNIVQPMQDKTLHKDLLSVLVKQGVIDSRAFSLYIYDLNTPGGEILFGGVDKSKYKGNLVTVPFVERVRKTVIDYSVLLNDVRMTDNKNNTIALSTKSEPVFALIDSGNAATVLPDHIVQSIYDRLGVSVTDGMVPTVNCSLINDSITIDFIFHNDLTIKIPLDQLVHAIKNADRCPLWGIVKTANVPYNTITLGTSFLSSAYVVFDLDNKEASIAQAQQHPSTPTILQITSGPDAVPGAHKDWSGRLTRGKVVGEWGYMGCAKETVPRTIDSYSLFAKNMTIDYCLEICRAHHYRLAGLENGEECWCGNTLLHEGATGARGCDVPCKGAPNQLCGGRSRVSVFEHEIYEPVSNIPIIRGFGYMGCFREKPKGRLLEGDSILDSPDMTAGKCMSYCHEKSTAYVWAGLQYGKECFCSNDLQESAIPAPEADCSILCAGDEKEWCGGSSRLSVYKVIDSP